MNIGLLFNSTTMATTLIEATMIAAAPIPAIERPTMNVTKF
jgi:hypothetical protein